MSEMTPAQRLKQAIHEQKIRQKLSFDEQSGIFTWQVSGQAIKQWQIAGIEKSGYIAITVDGECLLAHRLAWWFHYGKWPDMDIDHINGKRADNRIANLRLATQKQNLENQRRAHRGNISGYLGVSWSKYHKKWIARITASGITHQLGHFDSAKKAYAAYLEAKGRLHEFQTLVRKNAA